MIKKNIDVQKIKRTFDLINTQKLNAKELNEVVRIINKKLNERRVLNIYGELILIIFFIIAFLNVIYLRFSSVIGESIWFIFNCLVMVLCGHIILRYGKHFR